MPNRFLLANLVALAIATQTTGHRPHWRETSKETIWTGRYGNCDHGYFVTLPVGVLGHDGLPPSPNHGFYINLAAPASDRPIPKIDHEVISVWDEYVTEDGEDPYTSALHHPRARTVRDPDGTEHHVSATLPTHLGNLKAMLVKSSYTVNGVTYVTEKVSALSRGKDIQYELRMDTSRSDLLRNERIFRQVLAGFYTVPIVNGECSND